MPKQTHSESLNFLGRHSKLLSCVRHVWEENSDGKIQQVITPGYMSALTYLMGCSATTAEKAKDYLSMESPDESALDWSRSDKAEQFVVELAAGSDKLDPVRQKLSKMLNEEEGVSVAERMALVVQ